MFVATSGASLSEMWGEVQRAAGAMERLLELLGAQPTIKIPSHPVALPEQGIGSVDFEDVNFSYPSRLDQMAISDFNISIKPGETVAFVGPSGAGKSTTFHLLLRFYDPLTGRLKIDGVDIAGADPVAVRGRIGVVPQETIIFGTSAPCRTFAMAGLTPPMKRSLLLPKLLLRMSLSNRCRKAMPRS